MEKSNVAFALITVILGVYIAVALLLSRARGARKRPPEETERKRSRPWTSFSS